MPPSQSHNEFTVSIGNSIIDRIYTQRKGEITVIDLEYMDRKQTDSGYFKHQKLFRWWCLLVRHWKKIYWGNFLSNLNAETEHFQFIPLWEDETFWDSLYHLWTNERLEKRRLKGVNTVQIFHISKLDLF